MGLRQTNWPNRYRHRRLGAQPTRDPAQYPMGLVARYFPFGHYRRPVRLPAPRRDAQVLPQELDRGRNRRTGLHPVLRCMDAVPAVRSSHCGHRKADGLHVPQRIRRDTGCPAGRPLAERRTGRLLLLRVLDVRRTFDGRRRGPVRRLQPRPFPCRGDGRRRHIHARLLPRAP